MESQKVKFIWRCAHCSNHLATIIKAQGLVKVKKKCPKCKSINFLNILNGDVSIKSSSGIEDESYEILDI